MSRATSLQSPADSTPGRKRPASQQVVSSRSAPHRDDPESSAHHFADVYAHPAAVAYAAAHPRRTIPKFGPYLLLQTLGEGEFGKVKLGLHAQWGEEVAVKLIRRGSIDSDARMSKVEREIEVLRTLKHPHIVRLYDVIETDKYIGIILEYASGGELFDHILASRYLRERDAAKLFAQLLSGVWYIHQKRIVHRDLKLENLLLDKGRNVIITDFGFANRFGSAPRRGEENPAQAYGDADAFSVAPDLMQTSCGSPCYAAPELVVSEGLYVGSAVDVWSCGVILYAMLAGYLPFDDDPANPDGDNINLLYKYIVSTPLAYPDYVSDAARGILSLMLQPDPRRRAPLEKVMRHPWLDAFWEEGSGGKRDKNAPPLPDSAKPAGTAFGRTVEDLEKEAMSQHQAKRLAYQRQMRALAEQRTRANGAETSSRGSTRPASTMPGSSSKSTREPREKESRESRTPSSVQRSQTEKPKHREPEFLYETSGRSDSAPPIADDDPFAPPSGAVFNAFKTTDAVDPRDIPGGYVRDPAYDAEAAEASVSRAASKRRTDREAEKQAAADRDAERRAAEREAERRATAEAEKRAIERKEAAEKKAAEKKSGFRHTVQVEYDGDRSERRADRERADRDRERADRELARQDSKRAAAAQQDRDRAAQREMERAEASMDREEKLEGKQKARGPSTSPVATLRGENKELPPSPSPAPSAGPPSAWHDIQVPMTPVKFATPPRGDADSSDGHGDVRASPMGRSQSGGVQNAEDIIQNARRIAAQANEIRRRESQTKGSDERPAFATPARSASQTGHKRGLSVTRLFAQNGDREPEAQQENLAPPAGKEAKKERRSTLTVMVGRATNRGKREPASAVEASTHERERERERHAMDMPPPSVPARSPPGSSTEIGEVNGQFDGASTSKARRVMDWFRTKSKARESSQFPQGHDDSQYRSHHTGDVSDDSGAWGGPSVLVHPPVGEDDEHEREPTTPRVAASTPSVASAPPPMSSATSSTSHGAPGAPQRTPSTATDSSFMARIAGVRQSFGRTPSSKDKERTGRKEGFRESLTVGGKKKDRMASKERTPRTRSSASYALRALRPHAGALDTRMLTTENPAVVIARAKEVLAGMGLEIQVEHECKLRCIRPKKVGGEMYNHSMDGASTSGSTLAAVAMMGAAGSNGVDRRGLPVPGPERRGLPLPGASADRSFSGGLRGLGMLMRRQNSQTAAFDDDAVDLSIDAESVPVQGAVEPLYGPPTHDALDEVRFALEITAFKNLEGQFLIEIRRLKGGLKSYKFLYETVRERLMLQQP
ncbi:CAMK/CAMKL/Kin4 protein kinase [Schizophyllum commune]